MSTIKSRHIWILYILLAAVVLPVYGQSVPGSNIVSRIFLSADETKAIEQRVYDNGLGDIVQEVQSYPGSTLPSVIVHHEYDELSGLALLCDEGRFDLHAEDIVRKLLLCDDLVHLG